MLKTMSSYFVRTLREDPADAEVESHKLLVRAGYIRRAAPGIYTWLPLGLQVLRKLERIIHEEMDRIGAQVVQFPALLPKEPYEKSNRWQEYGPNLFRLHDRKGGDYLLAPTHEEMFTLLVKDFYSSYRDLPLTLYQIQTKYRDEARPRAGLLRGREFIMKDAYSFDIDDDGLDIAYQQERYAYQRFFTRIGLDYVICSATSGAMGGSQSEEFLFPCAIGEDTFVRSQGGFAANVEAVTTVVPEPVDASDTAEAEVRFTPEAPTIEALVNVSNERYPREDRPWQASDMLKMVVVVATQPTGEEEVLALAVPGDREFDERRLEAALAPAEIRMATQEDLQQYPSIVAGYIGPQVLGPNSPDRKVDPETGEISGSPRFLADPRVVDGTAWVAGANKADHHVYHLVKGRDFEVDGVIEAANVRDGDPAPDGSGPLITARGIEVGHIFQLGRKYAEALGLEVLDQNGRSQVVTMGSYGIGVSRVLAALVEEYHDDKGIMWPPHLAPFDVHVLLAGKGAELNDAAEKIVHELDSRGIDVLYDDRPKMSAGVKFKDQELLGMPFALVIGRGVKDGVVELRERHSGQVIDVELDKAADIVEEKIRQACAHWNEAADRAGFTKTAAEIAAEVQATKEVNNG
ncbi:MAG: proline--tRNA ligase [Actinomycetaceae bacterium]|nr:proline--tRNA ligase [Actinomycetaceae bacterium]